MRPPDPERDRDTAPPPVTGRVDGVTGARAPAPWTARDGTRLVIRAIRPDDEAAMIRFHGGLTESTVYLRYFELFGLPERTAHERLARICRSDDDRELALVVEHPDAQTGPAIVAVGRLSKSPSGHAAEFAIVVADAWQRKGLGTELLRRLILVAREEGVERVWADLLPTNAGMRRTAMAAGFRVVDELGAPTMRAELRIPASDTGSPGPVT